MLKKNNPGCDCCGDTRVCLTVQGCGNTTCGVPYDYGFAVDVVDLGTGLPVASGTTAQGGGPPRTVYMPSFWCFTVPAMGTYRATISKSRYDTTTVDFTVDGTNYGTDIAVAATIDPAAGYGCVFFCRTPIKRALKLFDGTTTVDLVAADGGPARIPITTWRGSGSVTTTGQLYGSHGRCLHDAYGALLPAQAVDVPVAYLLLGVCARVRGTVGICVDACFPGLADPLLSNAPIDPPDAACSSPFPPVSADACANSTTTDMTAVVSCEPLHLAFAMDYDGPCGAIWHGGWEVTE